MLETFTEEQWVQNFWMRKETFDFLCLKLEPTLMAEEILVKQPLDVQTHVAVALYWLASSAEYRTFANLLRIDILTVSSCVHDVCNAMVKCLLDVRLLNFLCSNDISFPNGPSGVSLDRRHFGSGHFWHSRHFGQVDILGVDILPQ